jgi:hypothetical protein
MTGTGNTGFFFPQNDMNNTKNLSITREIFFFYITITYFTTRSTL